MSFCVRKAPDRVPLRAALRVRTWHSGREAAPSARPAALKPTYEKKEKVLWWRVEWSGNSDEAFDQLFDRSVVLCFFLLLLQSPCWGHFWPYPRPCLATLLHFICSALTPPTGPLKKEYGWSRAIPSELHERKPSACRSHDGTA